MSCSSNQQAPESTALITLGPMEVVPYGTYRPASDSSARTASYMHEENEALGQGRRSKSSRHSRESRRDSRQSHGGTSHREHASSRGGRRDSHFYQKKKPLWRELGDALLVGGVIAFLASCWRGADDREEDEERAPRKARHRRERR